MIIHWLYGSFMEVFEFDGETKKDNLFDKCSTDNKDIGPRLQFGNLFLAFYKN